ncbi:MAG: glycoside hydrolase [Verrucomicrobia bacterium]|nr:glycoside hydrolase [Verrucomicrobiota bacterium]
MQRFSQQLRSIRRSALWAAVAVVIAAPARDVAGADHTLSLAGRWRYELDREDAGIRDAWFASPRPHRLRLPGSLPAQGIGDDVSLETAWTGDIVDRSFFTAPEYEPDRQPGRIRIPFWLQPDKRYVGAAWYQRDFNVPPSWAGRPITLFLERPHWETRVWLAGENAASPPRCLGTNDSLSAPHEHLLGILAPGRYQLTIRVDNRLVVDVGVNSHSVSDHTQGNWNGLAGRLELRARPAVRLEAPRIAPGNDGSVRLEIPVRNALDTPAAGTIETVIREPETGRIAGRARTRFNAPPEPGAPLSDAGADGICAVDLRLDGPPRLWSEFDPCLYAAEMRLETDDGRWSDRVRSTFGFREIAARGTQFVLNGQPLFIRGTLDCCIFPLTGHPPTDAASWRRLIGVAKDHGLNNIRFHSWCPPEAAFAAADEAGFYLHVECGSWANQSTTLGDGKPVDAWIYREADRILSAYGNHPSFVFLLYGNEPGGPKAGAYLTKWVEHYKARDPRRLYSSGAGWPQLPVNQFHVTPDPRIQAWGAGLKSRINARPPETVTDYRDYIQARPVPVISHEIGQWCVYPNFDEIRKYRGYLKPRNFEIFRDRLEAHHMGHQARAFLAASGKLQTLCYKEDIESALRTPGMGGFQLLDLHDFPGQGTALVGVLDPFWESKGYVTAAEFRRFCNSTVPLALLEKRVFTAAESLRVPVKIAHFGPASAEPAEVRWSLENASGHPVREGSLGAHRLGAGQENAVGRIETSLAGIRAPQSLRLAVQLPGTPFRNDWDIWVYPAGIDTSIPAGITVVNDLDSVALDALDAGGRVLLLIPPQQVQGDRQGPVALGFSSIFWNTAWTRRQAPHTLGILCDPAHPLFRQFPTESHSNWQWWYLIHRAGAMILDPLPAEMAPAVQVIDDWFTARKLGLAFEARVGRGRLMVCSIDLVSNLESDPVVRQFRRSLLDYVSSDAFQPRVAATPEQIRSLFRRSDAGAAAK